MLSGVLRLALKNLASMVKPGGILLIDHRNYDSILDNGRAPTRNIYYNVSPDDIFQHLHVQYILVSYAQQIETMTSIKKK